MPNELRKAYLAALGFSLIVGFSFLASKIALRSASPADILSYRFFFAFFALLLVLLLRPSRLRLHKKDLLQILPLSLFYPLGFFSLQLLGLQKVSSAQAAIIQASIPFLTLVLATVFLQEKSSARQRFFMALSLSGVLLIALWTQRGKIAESPGGMVLLFLSAIASASNMVLIRKFSRRYSAFSLAALAIFSGFLVFGAASLGAHLYQGTLASYFSPLQDWPFLLSVIFLGIFSTLGTALLSNYALTRMEACRMSIFQHLSTVISILAGILFLGETLSPIQVLGAVLIVAGVMGTQKRTRSSGADPAAMPKKE